ncbi:hypothetical protein [Actinotalea sp. C106]|uniref:hypothetical protein n=1 Tax=Actinotalea sp. C106 TaxID=2908644 RepID=UPI0020298344|nr:hypothetical protein [Actinotalea sp. C106]
MNESIHTLMTPINEMVARLGLVMEARVSAEPGQGPQIYVRPSTSSGSADRPDDEELPSSTGQSSAEWEVQLRFDVDRHAISDDVIAAVYQLLDDDNEFVDDVEEEGSEMCCYLYGPDPDRLVQAARGAAALVALGSDAYLIRRDLRDESDGGERIPLAVGPANEQ